jgi:DNA polymerase-3 subunit delta
MAKRAGNPVIFAVVSKDRFLRGEALRELVGRLTPAGDSLGPAKFDGESASLAEVLDEVRTPSLLGENRVVVVDEADDFITANRPALEKYCANPSDTGCLILACQTMPKTTRLYKVIETQGEVITREVPAGRSVPIWIAERAKTVYGKRIGPAAAQRLREHIGDAPGWLDTELGKLAAYVGDRGEITPADIGELTGHHREEKVFAVLDAMGAGDASLALRQWEQVLATDRAAPGRAIAGLAWSVRRLADAFADWKEGATLYELSRRMFTDPGTLQRRFERVSTDQLAEQQSDLLAADVAVKTGGSTVEVAIEKFIVKHSARSAGVRSRVG